MNTLKGVFNTQKPVHRKNFIRENVRQLREMQVCWQNKEQQYVKPVTTNKCKDVVSNVPPHVTRHHSKIQNQLQYASSNAKTRLTRSAPTKPVSRVSNNQFQNSTKSVFREKKNDYSPLGIGKNKSESKLGSDRGISNISHLNTLSEQEAVSSSSTSSRNAASASVGVSSEQHYLASDERTSRGCQTLDPENMDSLYNEGVIKYPSCRKSPERIKPSLRHVSTRDMALQTEVFEDKKRCRKNNKRRTYASSNSSGMGDTMLNEKGDTPEIKIIESRGRHSSDFEQENYEPENLKTCGRNSAVISSVKSDGLKAPSNYQKGVVPKYLRERQQEWRKAAEEHACDSVDPACPPGHVLLPDPDRKDTLKMLKKSYADLVQELNMMPVRSDTLKIRQRKMQLEKQLNKLEEGIKVFSRPKVYVKVAA